MGKYISLGEYNKLYKYIWIYLSIKFFSIYIFDANLVFEQIKSDVLEISYSPFISIQFDFMFYIIISLIIKIIQKLCENKNSDSVVAQENYLIK